MKVKCNLQRVGGSIIEDKKGKKYHFKPETKEPDAPHVCEVADEAFVEVLLHAKMNGAYELVDGVAPGPKAVAGIALRDPEDTLDKAIAGIGQELLEGGEYFEKEDSVAAQMARHYGVDKQVVLDKLAAEKKRWMQPALFGSDTIPAIVDVNGHQVQLGTIVAEAHTASGLSEEAWNQLDPDERDKLLLEQIEAFKLSKKYKAKKK